VRNAASAARSRGDDEPVAIFHCGKLWETRRMYEFERDRIGKRIRATKRAQKARGEYLGGIPPFGWTYNAGGKKVAVPEQQAVLRRIRKLAAEGLSPYKISADLAAHGTRLSHTTVRKILAGRSAARSKETNAG
jgi:DNA invertase Pin-like site-specific DNA recombinase